MRTRHALGTLLAAGLLTSSALALAAAVKPPPAAPTAPAAAARTPGPFDAAILEAAAAYSRWPRVSDKANWAPTDCKIMPPAGVQRSESADDATHGRKLYFLYASNESAYEAPAHLDHAPTAQDLASIAAANVGQVLVKDSFHPKPVEADQVPALEKTNPWDPTHPVEYAQIDGKWHTTGERHGLFIMLKVDPRTEGTDEGWVYATTSADGKTILDAGRIESCMKCHTQEDKTIDRLFLSERTRRQLDNYRVRSAPAPTRQAK